MLCWLAGTTTLEKSIVREATASNLFAGPRGAKATSLKGEPLLSKMTSTKARLARQPT